MKNKEQMRKVEEDIYSKRDRRREKEEMAG